MSYPSSLLGSPYHSILFPAALFETKGRLFECWDQNRGRQLQILLMGDLCYLYLLLLKMVMQAPIDYKVLSSHYGNLSWQCS